MTLEEQIVAMGFTVDHGDLIDGPFIPDGTVRIYRGDDPWDIVGEGDTVEEAASRAGLPDSPLSLL